MGEAPDLGHLRKRVLNALHVPPRINVGAQVCRAGSLHFGLREELPRHVVVLLGHKQERHLVGLEHHGIESLNELGPSEILQAIRSSDEQERAREENLVVLEAGAAGDRH